MKITLLITGKNSTDYVQKGIDMYSERIKRYIDFQIRYISDNKVNRNINADLQKRIEGQLLIKVIDKSDAVILLDERGKQLRSLEFSRMIEQKMINSTKHLVFIIGGPYGFSDEVYQRANAMISLSKMTFPHELIRLFITEQLYRAFSIINHEPYHHE